MTAPTATVRERVRALLTTNLGIAVPESGGEPIGDGALDSLMLMEILSEVELEFGTRVDFNSFEPSRLRTLDGLVAWIEAESTVPPE
jgi:acyl carrier protein